MFPSGLAATCYAASSHPPNRGGGRAPFAGEFMCFPKVAELEGPDRRGKPPNGGGEPSSLAIRGVGSAQRFLNLGAGLGLEYRHFNFEEIA